MQSPFRSLPLANATPLVTIKNSTVVANSRDVAAHFEKRHDNVLRDIEAIIEELPSIALNFEEIEINVEVGFGFRSVRAFDMTRKGFMMLVMGYNGKKAMGLKSAYIDQYDAMEETLKAQAPMVPQALTSHVEALRLAAVTFGLVKKQLAADQAERHRCGDGHTEAFQRLINSVDRIMAIRIPSDALTHLDRPCGTNGCSSLVLDEVIKCRFGTPLYRATVFRPVIELEHAMSLTDMTEHECFAFLEEKNIAHLACISESYPFLVPIHYAFEMGKMYVFSLPGIKITALRACPYVCVQVEEVTGERCWKSVLIQGMYNELPDTPERHNERIYAWNLLQKRALWWEPGSFTVANGNDSGTPDAIFFSVSVDKVSGRQMIADAV